MDTPLALPLPAPRRRSSALPRVAAAIVAMLWSSLAAAEPRPALKDPAAPQSAPPAEGAGAPLRSPESIAPIADNGSMQRTIAVVTGLVGFSGIAVGSVFGGLSIVRWNQVKDSLGTCKDKANYSGCPEDPVKKLQLEASAFATVSTYSIVAGTAGIGGAIAMWYLSPRLPRAKARLQLVPVIRPGVAGGFVMGVF